MPEYLFVRILEACNAGCEMCGFAFSKDPYRFSPADLDALLSRAKQDGIRFVRFTGGEPLAHPDIVELVAVASHHGLRTSIITNGLLLCKLLDALGSAGLEEVVVSIDSATPELHDQIRRRPGLFERAVEGLRRARSHGLRRRVNTVCGPSNFRDMPRLQVLLTSLEIDAWELSSLKLEGPLDYREEDLEELDRVVEYVYRQGHQAGRLVPMGKVWCGETPEERERYLKTGVPPRPDRRCHVVNRIRYLDARNGLLFPCSLLPHRPNAIAFGEPLASQVHLHCRSHRMQEIVQRLYVAGPQICTGCSSTAAGFSNTIDLGHDIPDWAY
ncbi:MAG: hypothetical protein AMS22_05450 [Thiotrichales bacterium SG8_50]|nr:MAG: hypothetical protein AMS22_05450 [Thiotrichales bacterium SG8_50]